MKICIGYIIGIFLLQGTIAEPLFLDVMSNIGSNIAKGISDTATSISQNIPSGLNSDNVFSVPDLFGNAMKAAIDVAGGFGQTAAQLAGNAIQIGTNTLKSGVDAVTNVGKVIENGILNSARRFADIVQKSAQVINPTLRNAINYAKKPISDAQSALKTLNNLSRNRLTRSLNQINQTIDAQNRLKGWAQEQKSKFEFASDEAKEKANNEIDNFIKQREKETQKCAKNVMQPIQKLFNDQRKFVESNLPAVQAILSEIEKCMKQQPTFTNLGACARNIRQNVSKIRSIPLRAANLKRKFVGTAADEVLSAPCIAETRIKIEQGKKNVEKKLDELLAADSTTVAPTTESADDSTTASLSEEESSSESTTESAADSTTASLSDETSSSEASSTGAADSTTASPNDETSSSEASSTGAADSTTASPSDETSSSEASSTDAADSSTAESSDSTAEETESVDASSEPAPTEA